MIQVDVEKAAKMIRNRRKELGLTQDDLVDDVIKRHTIRKAEKGEKIPQEKLEIICKKLELDMSQLTFSGEGEKEKEDRLQFVLFAIEHDISMVSPEEGLEELRKLEVENNHPYLAQVHYLKGKCYAKKEQWEKASTQYLKTLSMINQHPELEKSNLKAATYNELGRYCYYQNNIEQALHYVEKGLEAFHPDGEREYLQYHLQLSKVLYLQKMNRSEDAQHILDQMWMDYHRIDSTFIRLGMHEEQASLLIKQEMYEKAVQYAKKAITIARLDGSVNRSFELWVTLGKSYSKRKEYFEAEWCFRTALKIKNKVTRKHLIVSTYTNLGVLYLKTGKIPLAQKNLMEAVKLGKRYNIAFRYCEALVALGDCYLEQDLHAEGKDCYQQALSLAEQHKFGLQEQTILLKLANCCKRDDPDAYETYKDRFFQIHARLLEKGESDNV